MQGIRLTLSIHFRVRRKGGGVCKGQKTWRQSLVRLLQSWGKRWTHSLSHVLLFFQSFSYWRQDFISSFRIAHQEYKASPYLENTLFVEKYPFPIRELTRFWQHNAKLHFFQERTIFQHVPQCVTGKNFDTLKWLLLPFLLKASLLEGFPS